MGKKFDVKYILRIAVVLFIICALTALLLAVVNGLTAVKIAENAEAKMNNSIYKIFGEEISPPELKEGSYTDAVKNVYEIKDTNGSFMGYAVYTVPVGFKGDIEMMVGINPDMSVKSVEIINLSETPGLGTKVKDEAFIGQYNDKSGDLELKEDIIPVAGATISSRAVNDGINEAVKAAGGIKG